MPELSKLTNLPKGMFRLWQPYEVAYMLGWNATVAEHTARKLSEKARAPVIFKAGLICAENNVDSENHKNVFLVSYFLSLALAHEGIRPILERSPAKWFWVVNPFAANIGLTAHLDEIMGKVERDLSNKHGVRIEELESLAGSTPQVTKIRFSCPHCGQSLQCDRNHQSGRVRCPLCGQVFPTPLKH